MNTLLTALLAALSPLRLMILGSRETDGASLISRLSGLDQRVQGWVEKQVSQVGALLRLVRQASIDSAHGLGVWAAAATDRTFPSPLLSPDLAMATAAPARLPHPVAALVAVAKSPLSRVIDNAEVHFSTIWPDGRAARHAARTFVTAAAVGAAGLAAAASVLTSTAPLIEPSAPLVAAPVAERHAAPEPQPAELPAAATAQAAANPKQAQPAPSATVGPNAVPARRGAIPVGKGMWIYVPKSVENGDPVAIVARAKAVGLTHVYVRTGSTYDGFYAQDFLNALLPVAHANGIRVYGWDFPHLDRPGDDVQRAWAAITYKTPDGHRIDGFAPDIETPSEGTNNNPGHAAAYGDWLRQAVGKDYPLIAVVPRPSAPTLARGYPYAQVVDKFDAIAPMVYWMDKDPGAEVANAMQYLAQFGKPVIPIGQAYDGGIDGGPGGRPSPQAITRFMQVAWQLGAPSASFWSWQHADQPTWDTIRDAGEFRLPALAPSGLNPQAIGAYQHLLNSLGFGVTPTGIWDPTTDSAVRAYQRAARLPESGVIDQPTLNAMLTPFKPPLPPGVDNSR